MSQSDFPFRNPDLDLDTRARDLLDRLSLEEKVAQMNYESPAVERLDIPAYNWWNECLHGVGRAGTATVFPQAIGLASTFDTDLMLRVATAISDEARAKYYANAARGDHDIYHGLTYWTPNINIFRDPRWGRGHETYGECPYLTAQLGIAFVNGLQGDDPNYLKLVATPKHFAVHSGPEGLRHEFDAIATKKDMYETYLPAFRDCVQEAGAWSVMGAYNRTNGEPCCASKTLLQDILRDEWGFEGYVVSDCSAIRDLWANHKVVDSPEEGVAMAVRNGCDLNCGGEYTNLVRAFWKGLISEAELDTALLRLIKARIKLGMFDPPERVPWSGIPYDIVAGEENTALALEAARSSVVLLKNEGDLLPLKKDLGCVAVIGPNADNRDVLLGNYAGTPPFFVTALEGIRAAVSDTTRVLYHEGCDLYGHHGRALGKMTRGFAEALAMAERADVVVMVMGISPRLEGEQGDAMNSDASGDRINIALTGAQNQLLAAMHDLGKPVVLVLNSGSALAVPWAKLHVPAIVQQFYSGQSGGTALADVLFGDHNPSGRLPVTMYRGLDQVPPFEDYAMDGRTYRYFDGEPVYPFGFGLSYTRFEYGGLEVPGEAKAGDDVSVRVKVTNTGGRDGHEVVQVYAVRSNTSVRYPLRQLVGVKRVALKAGDSAVVDFTVAAKWLALVDEDGKLLHEPGSVEFSVGGSQPDPVSLAAGAPKPVSATVRLS